MTIKRRRLQFENKFAQIPNQWLRDKRITYKARGLLGELMTHEEGWTISQASLVVEGGAEVESVSRHAVRLMVGELVDAGYLVTEQGRNGNRFGEVNYWLTDPWAPVDNQGGEPVEKPVDN